MSNDKSDFSYYKTFILVSQLGIIMISSIIIFTLLGLYLGTYIERKAIGIILGVIFGLFCGFFNVYKQIKKVIDISK